MWTKRSHQDHIPWTAVGKFVLNKKICIEHPESSMHLTTTTHLIPRHPSMQIHMCIAVFLLLPSICCYIQAFRELSTFENGGWTDRVGVKEWNISGRFVASLKSVHIEKKTATYTIWCITASHTEHLRNFQFIVQDLWKQ
jgi:hypothetical protein